MAYVVDDRVLETTTTTGTGALTLAGAITGFKAFSAAVDVFTGNAIQVGDVCAYYIEAVNAIGDPTGDYEDGIGTYSAASQLTRTTVLRSSNANAAVNFAAGTKRVGISGLARKFLLLDHQDAIRVPSTGTSVPSTPAAGILSLFAHSVGGRLILAQIGPSGIDTSFQPFLARNKIGYWNPPGNSTTVPGVFGFTAVSTTGTTTARNVATTNVLTRMRRIGWLTTSTAGSRAAAYVNVAQFTIGDGSGNGGFTSVQRFGLSDASDITAGRTFVGMSSSTSLLANSEPNTLTNCFGLAQLGTDTTQWYIVYGGSAAQTAVALGTGLGSPYSRTTAWELVLFASPADQKVNYEVTNLGTGAVVSGSLGPGTPGTTLPSSSTFLAQHFWRSNNATATQAGIDVCSSYIETDN